MAESWRLHYYRPVRSKVLCYIRDSGLMHAGDRVAVAVSGGADSVALLRVLLELRVELGIVLAVAHFNHGLRSEKSEVDQAFVADLTCRHGLEFFASRSNVHGYASTSKLSLEAAGRELRYAWFAQLADEQRLNSVATAHTFDDQAETVLLKFLRGAGTRGLAGIYPQRFCGAERKIRIVRPLLCVTRDEVEAYLSSLGQEWREDESNLDRRFARNRVRHELLPLLEREYNLNLRWVLSDTAEVSRAEEEYWHQLVERELESRQLVEPRDLKAEIPPGLESAVSFHNRAEKKRLSLANFQALPLALQRRLLRRFAESRYLTLDFEHAEKLLRCAIGELTRAELPGGWLASRRDGCLELRAPTAEETPGAYDYALPVPGEVRIAELGATLRAIMVTQEFALEGGEPENFLRAELLGPELTVRNWRHGDRFWPVHGGSEEKLKRLFAEKKIPQSERATWPVVLASDEIVWVRGFPVAREYGWHGKGDAVRIECIEESSGVPPGGII